jgi:HNH/ENDO VII superfamily nuclease
MHLRSPAGASTRRERQARPGWAAAREPAAEPTVESAEPATPDLEELHASYGNAAVAMAASTGELPGLAPTPAPTTVPEGAGVYAPPTTAAEREAQPRAAEPAPAARPTAAPSPIEEPSGPPPEVEEAPPAVPGVPPAPAPAAPAAAPPTAATAPTARALEPRAVPPPAALPAAAPGAPAAGVPTRAPGGPAGVPARVASGDVDAVLPGLASVPPSQLAQGVTEARQAVAQGFDQLHDELAANPPTMVSPRGLPRAGEPPRVEEGEPQSVPAPERVSAEAGEQPRVDTRHEPSTAPLPASRVSTAAVDRVPEGDADAVEEAAIETIAAIPVTDGSVDTSAGERPRVALTGEANPAQMAKQTREGRAAADGAWTSAMAEMQADESEQAIDAIQPTAASERLVSQVTPTKLPAAGGPIKSPSVDPEVAARFDVAAAGVWGEKVATAQRDQQEAKAQKEADERAEREKTAGEITQLEQQTAGEQTDAQLKAKGDVAVARAGWKADLMAADKTYTEKAASLRTEYQGKIDAQKQQADADAQAELAAAEAKAAEKKRAAEAEAAEKKRAEQKKPKGFWASIRSAFGSFFSALKNALNAVFDALRSAVKFIIETAKKVVVGIIELARKAIVGLIHAFGELLLLAVDVFLAAFPEARKRAKAAIRGAVAAAEDAVNRAAEALKAGVSALLDALGAALDFVLGLYQKAYNLILDAIEFLVVGLLEILEKIGNLVSAAREMPDHFWGQFQEEILGMNLSEPLPFERSGPPTPAQAAQAAVAGETITRTEEGLLRRPALTENDVEADSVGEFQPEPELLAGVDLEEGEEIEFGENPEAGRSAEAAQADATAAAGVGTASPGTATVPATEPTAAPTEETLAAPPPASVASAGETPEQETERRLTAMIDAPMPATCEKEKEGEAADTSTFPEEQKFGPLSTGQRARYLFSQMKKGVTNWFSCNWQWLLLAVIGALLGLILANLLTGGAIMAALPIVMQLVSLVMAGMTLVKVASYVGGYLSQGWAGEIVAAAKSLARGLAIGAIELVFAVLFNLGAIIRAAKLALKSGIRVAAKAAVTAAKTAVKATVASIKSLPGIARTGLRTAVKNSKLILRGIRGNVAKGARSLEDLAKRLWSKVRFRKFKIRRAGKRIQLWGYINPWALLADGQIVEVKAADGGPLRVGDAITLGRKKGLIVGVWGKKSRYVADLPKGKAARRAIYDELSQHTDDAIKRIIYNRETTAQLRKGIPGPHPPNFQAHHVVPRELRQNSQIRDFMNRIGFDWEAGARNGIMLPPSEGVKALKSNAAWKNAAVHLGSHPNYTNGVARELSILANAFKQAPKNKQTIAFFTKEVDDLIAGLRQRLMTAGGKSVNEVF